MRHSTPIEIFMEELVRTYVRLRNLFAEVNAEIGLTSLEVLVLTTVVEADFAPTVPQIGRILGSPRQVIQRATNVLMEKGLLERMPNPDHKRAPLLAATAAGLTLANEATARSSTVAYDLLKHIEGADCLRMADDLKRVRVALEAQAAKKPADPGGRRRPARRQAGLLRRQGSRPSS